MLPYVPLQRIPAGELPPVPSCEPDVNWGEVVLALHCEGADGSTTFTDSSTFAQTTGRTGTASISTTQKKFGTSSAFLPGGSTVTAVQTADLRFLSGDFTMEGWFYFTSVGLSTKVFSMRSFFGDYNGGFSLHYFSGGWTFQYSLAITPTVLRSAGFGTTSAPPQNQWVHVAVTKSGLTVRLFVNGVPGSPQTLASELAEDATGAAFSIGGPLENNSFMTGYFDDIRITKGFARYTAAFTPSALSFCDGIDGEDPTPIPAPAPPETPPASVEQFRIAPFPATLRVGQAISAQQIGRIIGRGTEFYGGGTALPDVGGITFDTSGLPPGVGSLALSLVLTPFGTYYITASGTPTTAGDYRATVNLIQGGEIVGAFIWSVVVIDPPVFTVNEELDPSTYRATVTVGVAADVLIASPTLDRAGEVSLTFVPEWISALGLSLDLNWTSGTPGTGELRLTGTPTRTLTRDENVSPGFVLDGQLLTTTSFRIRTLT